MTDSPYLNRRGFLGTSAAAGVTLLAATAQPRAARAALAGEPGSAAQAVSDFELDEVPIRKLQEYLASGEHTAQSLAKLYIERIEAIDRGGPALAHVLEINPDALEIAAALDRERKESGPRGPLHGVPVLIKDNIGTADKMQTTAGSLALLDARPQQDSFVAEKLRRAGAVILGKTSLSEWANFRSTRSSSGWCARGGQGKNPYVLDRNPSGSSSGTGGAISASLAAVGVGTETDGSIVSPSSACGLVGIKPTLGLISRAGIIPLAHSQDTAGPMARTVTDAAILLSALAGSDPRDAATALADEKKSPDYAQFLDARGLKGARIGVARKGHFGRNPVVDKIMEEALALLRQCGAEVIDPADIPHVNSYDDTEYEVLLYEFKHDLNAYLASLGPEAPVKSLEDVIAFNDKHRDKEMLYFGQEIMLMAQKKGPLTEKAYLQALARNHRLSREEGLDAVLDQFRLDALVAPTGPPAPPIDLVNGDPNVGPSSSTPAAVSGYPSITLTAGYAFGLPVGISFIGRAWSEPTLLKLSFAFEHARGPRQTPKFLPTLPTT